MGFDMFVGFFENGEAVHRNRSIFDGLRHRYGATWHAPTLVFPDGVTAEVYGFEEATAASMMISCFGGGAFFDILFDLIRGYGAVLGRNDVRDGRIREEQ